MNKNKAVYTTTSVACACASAGAVMQVILVWPENVKWYGPKGRKDKQTDRQSDRVQATIKKNTQIIVQLTFMSCLSCIV